MLLRANVHALHTSCRPPARAVPMTELRILGHGFEGDEFQAAKIPIANSPVLRGGAHILSFVRTRTRRVLNDVASPSWIQHAIVSIDIFLASSCCLVRWIVTNCPVFLPAIVTPTTVAPVRHAVLGRQVVST